MIACLSIYLFPCLSVCLSIFICLPIACLLLFIPVYACLSICLTSYLLACLPWVLEFSGGWKGVNLPESFDCLPVCPSVCLLACLPVCLSLFYRSAQLPACFLTCQCMSVYMLAFQSSCQSACLSLLEFYDGWKGGRVVESIRLSVCLPLCLPVNLCVFQSVYRTACLQNPCLSLYQSICLLTCQSMFFSIQLPA